MEDILAPVFPLTVYPRGFLLLHEENVTLATKYDLASRFVFANDIRTMDHLEGCYDRGKLTVESLFLGDNRELDICGSVLVGVRLEYQDHWVYRYNRTDHLAMAGSSGSCLQVAAGLRAALLTLAGAGSRDRLAEGIHFCEALSETVFPQRVQEALECRELIVPSKNSRTSRDALQPEVWASQTPPVSIKRPAAAGK
jgi:hypothetical protein